MLRNLPLPPVAVAAAIVAACALTGCAQNGEQAANDPATERAAHLAPTATSTPKPAKRHRVHERASAARATPPPTAPAFVDCDPNISVKAATTTCPFAENVFYEYWLAGGGDIQAYSPAAEAVFDVSCEEGSTIVCSGGDGAEIHFSSAAVSLYDQDQADDYSSSHDLGPSSSEPDRQAAPAPNEFYSPDEGSEPGENIENYDEGRGYRVQCVDGMYSRSGGIQGACSGHGGLAG